MRLSFQGALPGTQEDGILPQTGWGLQAGYYISSYHFCPVIFSPPPHTPCFLINPEHKTRKLSYACVDSFSCMYGCVGVQVSMHEQAHTCEGQRIISGGFLWSTIHLFHIRVSGWTCSSPICLQLLRFMWLLGVELRSSWGQEWVLSSAFQNRKLNLWVIMSEGSNLY